MKYGTASFLLLLSITVSMLPAVEVTLPQVLVPGLEIGLFCAEPDIVTPVGIAVDAKGRVFVVENNTHLAKPDYAGPKSDRIKIYEDTNGDGRADKVSLFAEGYTAAMNLAFDPDGVLHLVHRNGVIRLEDHNHDGVCDKEVPLLTLNTLESYPHNGLSSISFTPDGWMIVGSGENFGQPYTATGTDGTVISYTPGGANIFRLRRDGSHLECYATGFWNAFALTSDAAGRIFACDNDPDSRPPCRFLHVVQGADYGYNFKYGRSGLHPFVCWNGELPGTLPMMTGTGEAPSGMIDARLARLGRGRGEGYLITEWGDSTLSWFHLTPKGSSFSATREVVIRGDSSFRPSCLAAAPDGSVFLTDWADREYSVHQKGRLWRIQATEPSQTPASRPTPPLSAAEQRRERIATATRSEAWPDLKMALADPDPFLVSAALTALRQPLFQSKLLANTTDPNPKVRLGCFLALRHADLPEVTALIRSALTDTDSSVRQLGMIWAAERRLKDLRPLLESALEAGGPAATISQPDFTLWLAAMDLIVRERPPTAANATTSNDELLQKLLSDATTSSKIKAALIPLLTNFKAPALIRTLLTLSEKAEPAVRQEAVRSLAFVSVKAVAPTLQKIALNTTEPAALRMDALSALAKRETPEILPILALLSDRNAEIAGETVRSLQTHAGDPAVKLALETVAKEPALPLPVKDQVLLALGLINPASRPTDDPAWIAALIDPQASASAERGRHVFFSASALCANCHLAEGRGVVVGPNLNGTAYASGRAKLIQSILEPNREIGPLYGTKMLTMKDGSVISGVQTSKDGGSYLNILQTGGRVISVPRDQIVKLYESPISMMPDGLELGLTLQDFRDLLAYLETLK